MEKYYITTPIYFVNDRPHIGHAYTTIAADVAARFQRMSGKEVFFLTGTDEHGLKVQRSADAAGKTPFRLADEMSAHFRELWKRLNISNSDFIRTTQERHEKICAEIFNKIQENGDIYLGEYEDWYCTPCESFWTEGQLLEGKKCPDCQRLTEKIKEQSYFFRLSKYQKPVLEYIEKNPGFIVPRTRRNEIISFVRGGLKDLSVSRATLTWGIPVPGDPVHVMYVWFDALTNYVSALDYPEGDNFRRYWPADVHLMSKDIIRFHAVYWPAFLMSAGLPLPKKVVVHGWWTVEGKKMSKSLGNAIDPHHLADEFGVDQLRYFLLREASFGKDGDFSRSALIARVNNELANELGNLLNRSLGMLNKYHSGIIPSPSSTDNFLEDFFRIREKITKLMDDLSFRKTLETVWELVDKYNKFVDDQAPWKLFKQEDPKLDDVMYRLFAGISIITVLLAPFMPESAAKMWEQLGLEGDVLEERFDRFEELVKKLPGTKTNKGNPIFPRIEFS